MSGSLKEQFDASCARMDRKLKRCTELMQAMRDMQREGPRDWSFVGSMQHAEQVADELLEALGEIEDEAKGHD